MSGGGGGASTPTVQTSATITDLPSWYNALTQQMGEQIGSQMQYMPELNQAYMGGGIAPQGGVFGGGGTSYTGQSQLPPPTPIGNPQWQGGGGNSMGAGIGGGVAKGMSSGGALNNYKGE